MRVGSPSPAEPDQKWKAETEASPKEQNGADNPHLLLHAFGGRMEKVDVNSVFAVCHYDLLNAGPRLVRGELALSHFLLEFVVRCFSTVNHLHGVYVWFPLK